MSLRPALTPRLPDPTHLREAAVYQAYSAGWSGLRSLPDAAAYRLFCHLADAAWRRRGRGVLQLEANLRRILPPEADLTQASRRGMRSYFRYWCDTFRLPDWSAERVVSRVRVVGEHNLRDNLDSGRGVCGALPHMGNWDHAGAWAPLVGVPVTTVAERLRPERLFERFLAFREGLGMEILPLGGSDVFSRLATRIREPRLVPLLADRDLTDTGLPVLLAGEPARMPPGPAALALRAGAALLPVTIWYEGVEPDHGIVLTFHPEVPPPSSGSTRAKATDMMQAVADVFSASLRAHPDDWHMLQRVFLADMAQQPAKPGSPRARSAPPGQRE